MRKALEEVRSAFCSFVVVVLFLFVCLYLYPLSFFLSWFAMEATNWGNGLAEKFEIYNERSTLIIFTVVLILQAEEEMRQRVALIAKIRAIESVPVIRFKVIY